MPPHAPDRSPQRFYDAQVAQAWKVAVAPEPEGLSTKASQVVGSESGPEAST